MTVQWIYEQLQYTNVKQHFNILDFSGVIFI